MQELIYLISIGFSGSDLTRALWIGLIASLFVSRRLPGWRVTALAFAVDRVWPFVGMRLAGMEYDVIMDSAVASIVSVPENAAYYFIRYIGFLALIYTGYNLRRLLHTRRSDETAGKASAYPY